MSSYRSLEFEGRVIEYAANPDGCIMWLADWLPVHRMADAGLLRRVHGPVGTFGHVDFYVVAGGES